MMSPFGKQARAEKTPARAPGSRAGALFGLGLLLCLIGLGAGSREAHAIAVSLDTSSLAGASARLEFLLLDGDGAANNSVTISDLVTNGTFGTTDCMVGCTGAAPYVIDDGLGLGQFLQDLILGTVTSFNLAFTTNFSGSGAPDRFTLGLLDAGTNFTLVDTNLDFLFDPVPAQDALLLIDLQGEGLIQAARDTDPRITVGVPEPGTLALLALGLAALVRRRNSPL